MASDGQSKVTNGAASIRSENAGPSQDVETEASRKALEGFVGLLEKGDVRGAIEQYTTENYTQHMAGVAPGRAGAVAHIEKEIASGGKVHLLGIVARGNMVGLHMRQTFGDGTPPREVIEIWRVEAGRLAEHWGIAQDEVMQK